MNKKTMKLIALIMTLVLLMLSGCSAENDGNKDVGSASPVTDVPVTEDKQYLGITPEIEIDLNGAGVYVYYMSNSAVAGYIAGETKQEITEANKLTAGVEAVANLGYKFVRWSDGSTVVTRSGDTVVESSVITAIFDYDMLEMPVISITTETGSDVTSKTEYINASLDIYNTGAENYDSAGINTGIRGRGNNTWGYPKKSYKLNLGEKQNLLGIGGGESKKWVLLANVCDQSLLRNNIAFEFARSLDGIAFAPASVSVEVYLNGEYRGVYLLAEEININKSRVAVSEDNIDKNTDIGFLVEMTFNAVEPTFTAAERLFQIHNDLSENEAVKNKQITYIAGYIDDCWKAVKEGNRNNIETMIDLNSLIDTYLVEEVLKNLDVGYDSYYLYKDKGGKLCFGPLWDFDLSQGNANEGCEFYTDLYVAENLKFQSNQWYYTMMDLTWFRELVLKRWDEISDKIYALPSLIQNTAQTNYNSFCRNFEKWKIFGTSQNRETEFITSLGTYTEHYEYLAEWNKNRIGWIEEYIHTDDYINGGSGSNGRSEDNGWREHNNDPVSAYGNDATEEMMTKYDSMTDKIVKNSVTGSVEGFSGEEVINAFDGNESTKYCFVCDGEAVITFNTAEAVAVTAYVFQTANDTESYPERNPDEWVIYGSNDKDADKNNSWSVISESTAKKAEMDSYNYFYYGVGVENPKSYCYYKIMIKSFNTLQFSEFIIYG